MEAELEILIKALKAGFVNYPIDCPEPEDCYRYRVNCLYYNKAMGRFYIYVSDGVGELFAEDYGRTWSIAEESE